MFVLLGLSYVIWKDFLWSNAWNGKHVQILRWSAQISCQIYPPAQNCQWQEMRSLLIYVINESPFEMDDGIRSSFQMKCTIRSTCQMKYPDKLSDIPPCKNCQCWTINQQMYGKSMRAHLKWSLLKFTPRDSSLLLKFQVYCSSLLLKFTPHIWNCHAQQNMYWPIYVYSENPFKTVIFITALFITALHCVIWCWAIGEVSHTFITYKNEAIYVNFKFLLFLLCLWFHVVVVVCAELHMENNNKKNRNKKIHVNWSFCSVWSFIEKTSVKQE